MKAIQSIIETNPHPARELNANTSVAQPQPTLDSIIRAICLDAKYDSLKFVLRSDTGHDGE